MEKIKDKVVLIAGATGAIGASSTKLLAASGAKVFIAGRDYNKLLELAKQCSIPEENICLLDYSKTETIDSTILKVVQNAGGVDIFINAIGIGIIKPFEQITMEEMQNSLTINLIGPFQMIKAILPEMKEKKKGLIINIPGILGKTPMAGATAYAASKYGLNGMMKSLREELKRTDIRITQLFLGGVDSAFWDKIDLRVQRDKMIVAEEAGKAIWFLCQQPTSGVISEMVIQPFNHQVI